MYLGDEEKLLDMTDYKLECLFRQSMLCPVTMELTTPNEGEVLYVNGKDYFVSKIGLKLLRDMFGEEYINDKVVYIATERNGKIERDLG